MRIKAAYAKLLSESSFHQQNSPKKLTPVTDPEFVRIEKQLADFWKKWSFDARPNVEEAERAELLKHIESILIKNGPKK